MTKRAWSVIVVIALLWTSPVLVAEEQEETDEEQAMMAAWMELGTPGVPHRFLAESVGEWGVTVAFWAEPGQDPLISHGRSTRKMILGERVLHESFTAEVMGMPFEGIGLTGYDNAADEYWATWNDTMTTALMVSRGHCTDDGKICTYLSSFFDPMVGKPSYSKTVITRKGENREEMESWTIAPDGKETLTMRLVYERIIEE